MQKETILILGAGISGLIAARVLRQAGCRVQILEGRNRVGGRIHSIRQKGISFEAGPEFIHGHLHQTVALLEEYGISFTATAGRMYHVAAGKISEEQGFDPDWESLIEKMKSVRDDMPLKSFLEIQFPGDRFIGLRQSAVRFAEGFDLADADRVGVLSLAQEWGEEEGEQYRVAGGYGQLADALAAALTVDGVPIRLNCRVNSIEWEPHQVTVKTA
ncbi:MAG TPA: FAD-dependent oxidoreductase, partial [Puia sp.]|nr:FAD-dependent oxidoreductase [Puia sp.]